MKILRTDQLLVGMVLAIMDMEITLGFRGPFHTTREHQNSIADHTIIGIEIRNESYFILYGDGSETAPTHFNAKWCIDDEHDLRSAVLVVRVLNNQPTGEAT